jgi:hypothetical protein
MKKINFNKQMGCIRYFGIIIICVCLLFETGYAATYYVKNSGDDNASGLDDNSAWRTISKVNSFVFSKGIQSYLKEAILLPIEDCEFQMLKILRLPITVRGKNRYLMEIK